MRVTAHWASSAAHAVFRMTKADFSSGVPRLCRAARPTRWRSRTRW
ncbi:MAG TPA: hypothetical protein VIE39_09670 [Thermoanaerobaculia bacterium]